MPVFVITWPEETHEFCTEDSPPYEFSRAARGGRMRWEVKQPHAIKDLGLEPGTETDFTISWPDDQESEALWDTAGIPDDPPYWELGPEEG